MRVPHEPPYADRHVRWCGRGSGDVSPYPIVLTLKRMNQLMAGNPEIKRHFEQMRGLMASHGWMRNGRGGMMNGNYGDHGSMMFATSPPKQ